MSYPGKKYDWRGCRSNAESHTSMSPAVETMAFEIGVCGQKAKQQRTFIDGKLWTENGWQAQALLCVVCLLLISRCPLAYSGGL